MLNELVSIVVIGYNVEKTILDCLNSLIRQTYQNLQVVFVDDGSTDSTADKVKNIAANDDRVKYVLQENQGSNSARKKGFSESSGNYVLFVDGDDVLISEAVYLVMDKMNENPIVDMIAYDYYAFSDTDGEFDLDHSFCDREYHEFEFLEDILNGTQPHLLWNKLYKREFLEKAQFSEIPSITMGDDMAANVRMALCRPFVLAIEDRVYGYRVDNMGVSKKPNQKYLELLLMMQDIEQQLEKNHLQQPYTELIDFNWFLLFYYYVVRNKYKYTKIQKTIYQAWKNQKIEIKKNPYIVRYLKEKGLFLRVLTLGIDRFELVEILITTLFGKKD